MNTATIYRIRIAPEGRFVRMSAWLVPRGCQREPMPTWVPEHATVWGSRKRADAVLAKIRSQFPAAQIEEVTSE